MARELFTKVKKPPVARAWRRDVPPDSEIGQVHELLSTGGASYAPVECWEYQGKTKTRGTPMWADAGRGRSMGVQMSSVSAWRKPA